MSESTQDTPEPVEAEAADETTPAEEAVEVSPEEALAVELAEMKDRWLRGKAELENSRRRQRQELEEARRFGAVPLLASLLTVVDTLQRAIDEASKTAEEGDALLAGLRLTEQQFLNALSEHGVEPFDAKPGETLDPARHRALLEQPSDEQAPGTILSVFQAGYMLHDRLLREAQVVVAKAPEPAQEPDEGGDDADV